jgi:hypothetical protein
MFWYPCIILREFQICGSLKLSSVYIIKISLKFIKLQYLCGGCWWNVVYMIFTIQYVSVLCLRVRIYNPDIPQ